MKNNNEEGIPVVRTNNFQKHYCTRTLVTNTEFDFRIVSANEKIQAENGHEFFVGESMQILTPNCAKELHSKLGKLIKSYEKDYGKIQKRNEDSKFSTQKID